MNAKQLALRVVSIGRLDQPSHRDLNVPSAKAYILHPLGVEPGDGRERVANGYESAKLLRRERGARVRTSCGIDTTERVANVRRWSARARSFPCGTARILCQTGRANARRTPLGNVPFVVEI